MKIPALLAAILLLPGLEIYAAKPVPTPASSVTPAPTPKPKKPGFFQRIFQKKPTPTPVPAATPSPTPTKRKRLKPTPTPTPVADVADGESAGQIENPPAALPPVPADDTTAAAGANRLPDALPPLVPSDTAGTPAPQPSPRKNAQATPTPVPDAVRENPMNQPIPIIGDAGSPPAHSVTPTAPEADPGEGLSMERIRYRKLKALALEDSKVRELRELTGTAKTIAERHDTLAAFYDALFKKMRQIDPSQGDLIDRMEAASNRRLDRMKGEAAPAVPAE